MVSFFPSREVAVDLFGWSIHWYGILYVLAFLVAWLLLPRLQGYRSLRYSTDEWSRLLSWGILGVLVGGRLGFILFYEPEYYVTHPLAALAVWRGGMSSHGGFLGVVIALLLAMREKRGDIWKLADTAVVPAAIGLALGRIGNFINQELYGSVTTLPWGIAIPGEEGLRHPTQLYAVAKNLLVALVCFLYLRWPGSARMPGRTFALFLLLYGLLRFALEFVRVPTHAPVDFGIATLTRGQVLTLVLMMAGAWVWWRVGWQARGRRPSGR